MATDESSDLKLTQQERSAMGIRPAIVPMVVYAGSAIKNADTIVTTWAPWLYLATVVVLLGVAQFIQRRNGKAWDWGFAVFAGFGIATIAWLVAIGLVNIIAPNQVVPG